MFHILKILAAAIVVRLVCAGTAGFGALEGWGRAPLAAKGDVENFVRAAESKLAAQSRGNYAYLQLSNWRTVGERLAKDLDPKGLRLTATHSFRWLRSASS